MAKARFSITRRDFLKTTIVAAGAAALPWGRAAAVGGSRYTRYSVMSDKGKKALASYAKGIEAMLKLPATHPQNWFRNTFIHLMDCPHGNWWFYVWHRGYLGYLEQTIRSLSGDGSFAMPYWDWTTDPQIPDLMFDGALSPANGAFEPYIRNLSVFTSTVQPALQSYWATLNDAQRGQLKARGYGEFASLWNDVTGYDPTQCPPPASCPALCNPHGDSGNIAYANPCGARYLTRANPKLDEKTAYDVSAFVVYAGLLPTDFYNSVPALSFTSARTSSHNSPPARGAFSTLEGLPHNKVHNYIGGVGPLDPGPYGYMTNFLSPVDPIFFLHHANLDRLWDVWTRKQKHLGLPYLPTGKDLDALSKEPFLFYVDGNGKYVTNGRAGDYLSMERFDYSYSPGFGEKVVEAPAGRQAGKQVSPPTGGLVKGNTASLRVAPEAVEKHLASSPGGSLVAALTFPRPSAESSAREFDVIVGAPSSVASVPGNSPYYAGTIAFFGSMMRMRGMSHDVTFVVPLPKSPEAFRALGAAPKGLLNIRIVPTQGGRQPVPRLRAAAIRAL